MQPLLDAIVAYVPSPAERGVRGRRRQERRRGRAVPAVGRRPARARSSGRRSPIRSPDASRCSAWSPARSRPIRRCRTSPATRRERLGHLMLLQGKTADRGPRDQGRRPRRGGQAEGDADERSARRQERRVPRRADQVSRGGHLLRDRAEEPRRRGEDQHRAAPAAGGRSDAQLQPRRADQGAAARRGRDSRTSR